MKLNNKRVLVIEDHAGLRYMCSIRLISAGYTVYGAANGLEGLQQMEEHSIDAVLTDYSMPVMNGFEFISACRMKWPGTSVVVFSGEQDDLSTEAIHRGAFAWVRKGCDFSIISELLAAAIQQSVHA